MQKKLYRNGKGQRPKILVVTERYWPEGSGSELATHLMTKLLADEFVATVITGTGQERRGHAVDL